MRSRFLFAALAASLLAASPALAQSASLTVNPDVLTQGETAKIQYKNPSRANQAITVLIDNGSRRNPQTAVVEIVLDAKGEGSATWPVPDWAGAKFNAPEATEVFCPIVR
ncbi:MAG: hypothetical protein KF830_03815 [Planctomycetes bacterium]|nr:hypothetical protein [Planctomycetota bacterium]